MHTRESALNEWLNHVYPHKEFSIMPLTGDASFRRYFRLDLSGNTRIVMDAPPEKEPIQPFIRIGKFLRNLGVHTPEIFAADEVNGFILLEDFGDQLLLKALSSTTVDSLYNSAMDVLLKIQRNSVNLNANLPIFDKPFMINQMALFQNWFLEQYLALELDNQDKLLIKQTLDFISDELLKQPYTFIHCDYHSRNLMLIATEGKTDLGIIDFQDAMYGPFTYDLVSLLKDCYVQWPRDKTLSWLDYFYNNLSIPHDWSFDTFIKGFDLCGLQRHLKVLGIFSRLYLRDNKAAYLNDLPLTLHYVLEGLQNVPELHAFRIFMMDKVCPQFNKMHAL